MAKVGRHTRKEVNCWTNSRKAWRAVSRKGWSRWFQKASLNLAGSYREPCLLGRMIFAATRNRLVASNKKLFKFASLQIRVKSVMMGEAVYLAAIRPERSMAANVQRQ